MLHYKDDSTTVVALAMCRKKHSLAVRKVHEHRRLPTTLEICPFPFRYGLRNDPLMTVFQVLVETVRQL